MNEAAGTLERLTIGGTFDELEGVPGAYWATMRCRPCYPECDLDGKLSVADATCFQSRWVAGDPYADCNADGILNVQDFGCFQTKFVAGCP